MNLRAGQVKYFLKQLVLLPQVFLKLFSNFHPQSYNSQLKKFFFNLQITFFIGMVFNELINTVLKYIIKQPRPISRDNNYNEYGMPSSHSQFVWFFSIYMFLFIWIRLQHITNTKSVWFSKTIVSLGCFAAALIVTVSRYIPPAFFFLFW